jgi:hypothetical protein
MPNYNDGMKKGIIEMYSEKGLSQRQIAKKYCIHQSTICDWLKLWEIKTRKAGRSNPDSFDETYFDNIDSEDKAYWLGFVLADGCIYNDLLKLAIVSSDLEHLQKFRDSISPSHSIHFIKNNCVITISSKYLVTSLERLGVHPRKSFTAYPVNLEKTLMRHYWRGVVDGDGWLLSEERKEIGLCGNKQVVTAFKNYCYSINRKIYSSVVSNKSIYRFMVGGIKAESILDNLYKDSTVYLTRKYEKYLEIKEDLKAVAHG